MGNAFRSLGQRDFGGIADGRDLAAAQVLDHQAEQQVVHVADIELQLRLGIAMDLAVVLKETDTGSEQDHALQRNGG